MSKHKNEKKDSFLRKLKKQTFTPIIITIATEIITAAIIIIFSSGIKDVILGDLPKQVDKLNEAESVRKDDIAELKTDIKNLQKEIATLTGNMDIIKEALFTKCDLSGSSLSAKPLSTIDDNAETDVGPGWTLDDIVALDSVSGKSYKTKDLINKQILMPYEEDGQNIYFLGEYDADNHWNGNCLINIYKDKKIVSIIDAIYDGGKLISYKEIMEDGDSDDDWSVIIKKKQGNKYENEKYTYHKSENIKEDFTIETVEVEDMIYADDFIDSLGTDSLKEYYFGNMSHGQYHDNTGKAYLLKYIEKKEEIRILYIGKFKNNLFSDSTGKAWYVELSDDGNYLYFRGKFKDNIPMETSDNKCEKITLEKIYNMLGEINFNHDVFLYDKNPKSGKTQGYLGGILKNIPES